MTLSLCLSFPVLVNHSECQCNFINQFPNLIVEVGHVPSADNAGLTTLSFTQLLVQLLVHCCHEKCCNGAHLPILHANKGSWAKVDLQNLCALQWNVTKFDPIFCGFLIFGALLAQEMETGYNGLLLALRCNGTGWIDSVSSSSASAYS